MGKFCLYADECQEAPCVSIKTYKYSYLEDFLKGNRRQAKPYSIPLKVECLQMKEYNKLSVVEHNCINCMFCIFGCIGNRILLSKNIHPKEFCKDITQVQLEELKKEFLTKLFMSDFINLPAVPFSRFRVKYKSFEEFTAIDETENIVVWGVNAMKYLSQSLEPRISLEVGLIIQQRDRGGRLDISLLNTADNYLFIAEAKVDFEKMMNEDRYESQLIAYETEMERICPPSLNRCKFLLIGGKESDLLPITNPHCTSTIGNKAAKFYNILIHNHFFFFSANAMLALGLMKMFVSYKTYSLENLYSIITNPEYLGILSSGVIAKNGDILPLSEVLK